jgi:hypothetical protein
MLGPSNALELVASYLEAEASAKLEELRERLGQDGPLTKAELRDFQLITTEDRAQVPIADYPAIVSVLRAHDVVRRVDIADTGGEVFAMRYVVRLYLWARGKTYAGTTRARNRYALAVTELLLERLSLGQDGVRIHPETMVGRPAEGARDKSGRSIAATYIEFAVTIDETVEVETLGTIQTGVIETKGAHPAL